MYDQSSNFELDLLRSPFDERVATDDDLSDEESLINPILQVTSSPSDSYLATRGFINGIYRPENPPIDTTKIVDEGCRPVDFSDFYGVNFGENSKDASQDAATGAFSDAVEVQSPASGPSQPASLRRKATNATTDGKKRTPKVASPRKRKVNARRTKSNKPSFTNKPVPPSEDVEMYRKNQPDEEQLSVYVTGSITPKRSKPTELAPSRLTRSGRQY